VINLQWSN